MAETGVILWIGVHVPEEERNIIVAINNRVRLIYQNCIEIKNVYDKLQRMATLALGRMLIKAMAKV